jgi:sec-independent protein translocase protein TatA
MPFGAAHWYDLLPLILLALLIFGPKRLPDMGASIGKTIKEFQKSMHEVTNPSPPAAPLVPSTTVTPDVTAPVAASIPALAGTASERSERAVTMINADCATGQE